MSAINSRATRERERERESLVFYAQSTSTVISGRQTGRDPRERERDSRERERLKGVQV